MLCQATRPRFLQRAILVFAAQRRTIFVVSHCYPLVASQRFILFQHILIRRIQVALHVKEGQFWGSKTANALNVE